MKAMIFAAGLGTRLKPMTDTMPKALVPLAGKTLLQWQIELLHRAGIRDLLVNVHHFPDMIINYLRENDNFGCNILISDEREELLDTGGGLKKAVKMMGSTDEPILACNVDILSNVNLTGLIGKYATNEESILVVSERATQRYLCFDEKGMMCGWTNVATGELKRQDGRHLAFSGMQVLSPEAQKQLLAMPESKFSLIDFYLQVCDRLPLHAYVPANYKMMDVGKIDQIKEAEQFAESLC